MDDICIAVDNDNFYDYEAGLGMKLYKVLLFIYGVCSLTAVRVRLTT